MLNIVIFGAPGSGKGTQSERIVEKFGINHISTGDVLRAEIKKGTELGKTAKGYIDQGQLLPDELIIDILASTLDSFKESKGVIFDGFPRTIAQAEALKKMLAERGQEVSVMLDLDVPEEELMTRLIKRGQESGRADDNEETIKLADLVRGKLVTFSLKHPVEKGTYLNDDGMLCYTENGRTTEIVHKDDIRIPGIHNVANYLTAIAAVWGEVSVQSIVQVAKNFGGVEHRIEFVREIDGVKWYNDSIATSPTRVIAGLNSFNQKLIVIAGGYEKKIPFEPLAEPVNKNVKILILMGATADKIEKAVTESPLYPESGLKIVRAKTLEEAVLTAQKMAEKGDIVTLSPACASFDLYPNFEARGRHFKQLVNEL